MDIASLKEALGDEKFAALQGYVNDLIGQRDTARNESITGRKKLKDDLAAAQALAAKALEKLGVESADDLDTLPDAKGQGEALKQFETKLKRAERERGLSFKQVVNDALRRGLAVAPVPMVAEPLPSYRLGTRAGIDLTKTLALAGELEDEALRARQTLGR